MRMKMAILSLLLLSFFSICFTTAANDAFHDKYRCPEVSTPHQSYYRTHNNKCYLFVNTERHWGTARDDCSSKGGHLVIILDQATQTFIEDSLKDLNWNRNGVWLGLTDEKTEGHWLWVTGDGVNYNNWAPGEPQDCWFPCLHDCGQLRTDDYYRWEEKLCSVFAYSYICQFNMNPPTTTTTTTTLPTTTSTTETTTTTVSVTATEPTTTTTMPTTTTEPTTTTSMPTTTTTETTTTRTESTTTTTVKTMTTTEPATTTMETKNGSIATSPKSAEPIVKIQEASLQQPGTIVGIVFGIIVAVGLLVLVFVFVHRRKCFVKEKPKPSDDILSFDNIAYSVSQESVTPGGAMPVIQNHLNNIRSEEMDENNYIVIDGQAAAPPPVMFVKKYDNLEAAKLNELKAQECNDEKCSDRKDDVCGYVDIGDTKQNATGAVYETVKLPDDSDEDESSDDDSLKASVYINDATVCNCTTNSFGNQENVYEKVNVPDTTSVNKTTEEYLREYDQSALAKPSLGFVNNVYQQKRSSDT